MSGWNARSYGVFRVALGAYLAVHFALLVPWGAEVWSSAGLVPEASTSPFCGAFPNLICAADEPWVIQAFLAAASGLAVALAIGRGDRAAAVLLWYALTCLFGRNPLTHNPGLPFLGWLLLAHACFGPTRSQRLSRAWRLPGAVYACAGLLLAAGYSYGGITKLSSPSWLDGSALLAVLENPLARPTVLRQALLEAPLGLLRLATWGALALELLGLPLALAPRARPWLWAALTGMHVSLLLLVDFADLTLGMLLFHALVFDPAWGPRAAARVRRLWPDSAFRRT